MDVHQNEIGLESTCRLHGPLATVGFTDDFEGPGVALVRVPQRGDQRHGHKPQQRHGARNLHAAFVDRFATAALDAHTPIFALQGGRAVGPRSRQGGVAHGINPRTDALGGDWAETGAQSTVRLTQAGSRNEDEACAPYEAFSLQRLLSVVGDAARAPHPRPGHSRAAFQCLVLATLRVVSAPVA